MTKILSYLFGEFVSGYIKKIIYIGLVASIAIAILAMWGSLVTATFYFIDKFQYLLDLVTNYSGSAAAGSDGSNMLAAFIGLLTCLGFYDAINDTKMVWLSGIVFIFGRILFIMTIRAYLSLISLIKPLLMK